MITNDLNTHDITLTNGKHAGERLTRVPASYLRWMANESSHSMKEYAKAELKRRNHQLPNVELSGHAIDNASLRVWRTWCELRNQNEGIYSWLMRITLEAIEKGEKHESGKIKYLGMKLVVETGEEFPVLKTIMK